jgi:superkiller protein 3
MDMRDSLALRAVAESMNERGGTEWEGEAVRRAQKAIVLAPWDLRNWQALAYVRTRSAQQAQKI